MTTAKMNRTVAKHFDSGNYTTYVVRNCFTFSLSTVATNRTTASSSIISDYNNNNSGSKNNDSNIAFIKITELRQ